MPIAFRRRCAMCRALLSLWDEELCAACIQETLATQSRIREIKRERPAPESNSKWRVRQVHLYRTSEISASIQETLGEVYRSW